VAALAMASPQPHATHFRDRATRENFLNILASLATEIAATFSGSRLCAAVSFAVHGQILGRLEMQCVLKHGHAVLGASTSDKRSGATARITHCVYIWVLRDAQLHAKDLRRRLSSDYALDFCSDYAMRTHAYALRNPQLSVCFLAAFCVLRFFFVTIGG
jgi:hypothetical protein